MCPFVQETALAEVKQGPIAEFPAGAMRLAALFTDSSHAELSNVVIEPGEDGRVTLMAATPICAVRIVAEGRADERVLVPGDLARKVTRRHHDAELVSIRDVDELLLSLRSYSADCTVAVSGPKGQVAFQTFPAMAAPDEAEAAPLAVCGVLMRMVLRAVGEADSLSLLQLPGALRVSASAERWSATLLLAGKVGEDGQ